jgi:hypothetical protein
MSISELSTESLFSNVAGKAASAVSAMTSTGQACFHNVIKGFASVAGGVSAVLKKGIAFTATLRTAHPKVAKTGLVAIGLVGAAYALHRSYPALKKTFSK